MIKDILKILLFLFLGNLAFSSTSETEINFSKISKNSNGNKIKIFGKRTEKYVIKNEKVFFSNKVVSNADINTFKVINGIFAKDKNNIYCNGKILKEADYETFETGYGGLSGSETYDKNNSYLFCQAM